MTEAPVVSFEKKKGHVRNSSIASTNDSFEDNLLNVERSIARESLIDLVIDRHRLIRCCWNGFWEYILSSF